MRRYYISLFLALSLLSSCSNRPSTSTSVRSVKVAEVEPTDYINRDFAGMATADDAVNLAFKISGQVASVDVSKGDFVAKGELLAQLDPRDVELQVAADKSQYERAESQFRRMKRLLDHEAVSQQEFEAAQASFIQARSVYENSKDLLADTKLRAPFDGVIERIYVDTYQRIESGQTILRLVNPRSTTIEFTMPEKSLNLLADSTLRFYVTFDNLPGKRFTARLHKYAKTSSDASGFPVALKIDRIDSQMFGISPGMTCQITMQSDEKTKHNVAIPLSAVYAPASGGTYVWVVNPSGKTELRAVNLGEIFGRDMVSVSSGLKAGEKVVIAGVYKLRNQIEVRVINL
ncbi:MAG: efflux RND transporter periplasmic adaptor subunit [Rikenellaceae bacterium]|nr:efflux RND transporter periplasmic adaptor subunit [Rikenellaceae bacterium]